MSKKGGGETVKVAVRCRPMNRSEKERKELSIVDIDRKTKTITLKKVEAEADDGSENKTFTFDYVYGVDTQQQDVFDETAKPIVDSVIGGYNGTIFAYGQTGTGKTFSMEGVPDNPDLRGIMPNSFHHVIGSMKNKGENTEYHIRMSFIEIYKEEVFDLLQKKGREKREVKESKDKGVFVKDLTSYGVKEVPEMLKILAVGQGARKVGATAMNAGSSRSHSILTVTVETSYTDDAGETKYKVGKLNLVDLAGSERQKRTAAQGERLEEAKSINLSLSALGNVIKALVNPNAKHIPFRDSKLTRLLQDSLGGNTKTCMLAAMSPGALSYDETLSTLRYANRAKNIKNKPKINEDPKDAVLREYKEQIDLLKAQLAAKMQGKPVPTSVGGKARKKGEGGGGGGGAPGEPETIVEENIIEQVEFVDTGISEADMKELKKRLEEEAAALEGVTEAEKRRYVEEKTRLEKTNHAKAEELRRKEARKAREEEEIEKIKSKLDEVAKNVGQGQLDIEQAHHQQEKMAEMQKQIAREQEAELNTLGELEKAEEEELMMERYYEDAKEDLQMKSKKLKKLWIKYNEKKEDIADLQEEFALEREDLVDTIRALDSQIKLKHLMVDAFVPPSYVELIEQNAIWDGVNDRWVIGGLAYTANNIERHENRDYQEYLQEEMMMRGVYNESDMRAYQQAMANQEAPPEKDVFYSYGPEGQKKKKKKNKN